MGACLTLCRETKPKSNPKDTSDPGCDGETDQGLQGNKGASDGRRHQARRQEPVGSVADQLSICLAWQGQVPSAARKARAITGVPCSKCSSA